MDFYNKYKELSNLDIYRILNNPEKYQDIAIEAATKIKNERNLDTISIAEIEAQLNAEKERLHSSTLKKKALQDKLEKKSFSILENLNPIQIVKGSTKQQINAFSLFLVILFIYQFVKDFSLLQFLFSDNSIKISEILIYILPLIYLPTTIYFFYSRKKIGWQLLAVFFSFSLAMQVYTCILFWELLFGAKQGTTIVTGIWKILIMIAFFSSGLYFLCQEKIRKIYAISIKTVIISIALGIIISSLIVKIF